MDERGRELAYKKNTAKQKQQTLCAEQKDFDPIAALHNGENIVELFNSNHNRIILKKESLTPCWAEGE